MMFTCLPLDTLPSVPDHFVDLARRKAAERGVNQNAKYYPVPGFADRDVRLADGTITKTRKAESYDMGPAWDAWVRENIVSEFIETGVRLSTGHSAPIHGAHVDNPVKWKFFYLIDEGGDNVLTSFYVEDGYEAVRVCKEGQLVMCNDYSRLTKIDTVHIPVNRWVLFDTRVMHGVENILKDRVVLTVSVDPATVTFEAKLKK